MAEIKRLIAMSEWLEFHLDSKGLLDPPVFRVRVRPISLMTTYDVKEARTSTMLKEAIVEAIRDWEFTENGKPVPCTEEAKKDLRETLEAILGAQVEGRPGVLVGTEILGYAGDMANFLKK